MKVRIQTMLGDIVVRLYDETPIHRDNFVKLVKEGYYDGTLFHRVIKDFMIQGGDPDSKGAPAGKMLGVGGPDYTLEAEIKDGLFHISDEDFGSYGTDINMWKFYNLLTGANKSSYIDSFLDRSLNATEIALGINAALHGEERYKWFID